MPRGIALLDTPDIDSVVQAHHEFAYQFLDASDLWLFMTSASRYADGPVWEILQHARERKASLGVVLSRIPQAYRTELADHFNAMLDANGIAAENRFVIPETPLVDGMLPPDAYQPVRDWLADTAARGDRRVAVLSADHVRRARHVQGQGPGHRRARRGAGRAARRAARRRRSRLPSTPSPKRAPACSDGALLTRRGAGPLAGLRGRRRPAAAPRRQARPRRRPRRASARAAARRDAALGAALRSALESFIVSIADRAAEHVGRRLARRSRREPCCCETRPPNGPAASTPSRSSSPPSARDRPSGAPGQPLPVTGTGPVPARRQPGPRFSRSSPDLAHARRARGQRLAGPPDPAGEARRALRPDGQAGHPSTTSRSAWSCCWPCSARTHRRARARRPPRRRAPASHRAAAAAGLGVRCGALGEILARARADLLPPGPAAAGRGNGQVRRGARRGRALRRRRRDPALPGGILARGGQVTTNTIGVTGPVALAACRPGSPRSTELTRIGAGASRIRRLQPGTCSPTPKRCCGGPASGCGCPPRTPSSPWRAGPAAASPRCSTPCPGRLSRPPG